MVTQRESRATQGVAPPPDDIVTLVAEDHEQISCLLARFSGGRSRLWREDFHKLAAMVSQHESAEEKVVLPVLRRVPGGRPIAEGVSTEQSELREQLRSMGDLDADGDDFAREITDFAAACRSHLETETATALPLVARNVSSEHLVSLGRIYVRERDAAPSRLHPHVDDNRLLGRPLVEGLAALIDTIRDASGEV